MSAAIICGALNGGNVQSAKRLSLRLKPAQNIFFPPLPFRL